MELTGNTILITGGTSGIGLAFAEQFSKLGNKVIICGRRTDKLKAIAQKNANIVTRICDVSNETERKALTDWIMSEHPGTNILINNAGVQFAFNLQEEINMEKVRQEIETNLVAPVQLSSLFASFLAGKQRAAIINISSGLAFVPLAFMPVYCATKAAIHSFTLSLRYQLKNTPVKVFEIAPPSVDTELGHDRRTDKTQTHGGMPVGDFLKEAMYAIEHDILEGLVGQAKNLREKNEQLFDMLNH